MIEKKRPWMKWYPSDWRADPKLRMCSMAARGLWADLISLMHEAEPYGHLKVNGVVPNQRQIAALVGAPVDEVEACLSELRDAGVYSVSEEGVAFSRRMVRDKEKEIRDRLNGSSGGNPDLIPEQENWGVNPNGKGEDKAHKPEAIGQKPKNSNYVFSGRVIRLKRDQFDRWSQAYRHIPNLTAALQSRDDWLYERADESARKNWFFSTSTWLAKLDQEYAEKARAETEPKKPPTKNQIAG